MKVYELLEEEDIAVLRSEIDLFAEIILRPYVENINKQLENSERLAGKEIFDPIWGPVEFNAGEIIFLDSPLIQRLRKIKQLGLASYVYCNADYSRFAHTIGVFSLAGQMANIIACRCKEVNGNANGKALKESSQGDHIVFFDDGAYSGKQVSRIFEEYMGVPLEKRSTKEHHVSPLNEEEKTRLKERNLSIAYMCFNVQNKGMIIETTQKLGVRINDIQYMYDMTEKIFESETGCLKEEKQRNLVKKWIVPRKRLGTFIF